MTSNRDPDYVAPDPIGWWKPEPGLAITPDQAWEIGQILQDANPEAVTEFVIFGHRWVFEANES